MAEVFPLDINDAGDEENLSSDDEFEVKKTFEWMMNIAFKILRCFFNSRPYYRRSRFIIL